MSFSFDKNPASYAIGENIVLTVNDIPFNRNDQPDMTYALAVTPKGSGKDSVATAYIHVTQNAGDTTQNCTIELIEPNKAGWLVWENSHDTSPDNQDLISCTHPRDGTDFTFKGTINGNKINEDPNATADQFYSAFLSFPGGPISDSFLVKPATIDSSFIINQITSDGVKLYPDSPKAVLPGKVINITFSPVKNFTTYVWGKAGDINNPSGSCIVTFFGNSCTKSYTIPNDAKGQFNIDVLETGTNKLAHAAILVSPLDTPVPPVSDGNGAPTFTPVPPPPTATFTPAPPLPPCANSWFHTNGKFYRCDAVSTGLGFAVSTQPAKFVRDIFAVLLSLSGGIAILLIIRAGYQMMTSAGNPEAIKEARDRLTSAVIGLLFLIFSMVILEVIGVDILHIPGLTH